MDDSILLKPSGTYQYTEGRFNVYNFNCQDCPERGLVRVPVQCDEVTYLCPNCGAKYMQFTSSSPATPHFHRVK